MAKFRVDRATNRDIPVGMNSILYLGDSLSAAHKAFVNAEPGIDTWGKPDSNYGVLLSSTGNQYCDDSKPLAFKK